MATNLFEAEFITKKGSRAVIRIFDAEVGSPRIELTLPDRERPGPFTGIVASQSDGTMKFVAGTRRDPICVTVPATVAASIGDVLQARRDRGAAQVRARVVEGVARSARETTLDPTFGLEEWLEGRGM